MKTRQLLLSMAALLLSVNLLAQPGDGGGPGGGSDSGGASTTYAYGTDISSLWQSGSDYYYIVGLFYCASPADETYEQMGIYIIDGKKVVVR